MSTKTVLIRVCADFAERIEADRQPIIRSRGREGIESRGEVLLRWERERHDMSINKVV